MPWAEASVMELREEFVRLALAPGANVSALSRHFGIERSTGRKWIERYKSEGLAGLADRSRRPHGSPYKTGAATEAEVLRIRAENNNAWGARKIAWTMAANGWPAVPATGTITDILRRHGELDRDAHTRRNHVALTSREKRNCNAKPDVSCFRRAGLVCRGREQSACVANFYPVIEGQRAVAPGNVAQSAMTGADRKVPDSKLSAIKLTVLEVGLTSRQDTQSVVCTDILVKGWAMTE